MRLGTPLFLLLLATACGRSVDPDAAPNARAHSAALDPTPEVHRLEERAARALLEEDDPGRAVLLYRKAEMMGPLSREGFVLGARAAARTDRPHKAVEWLELAVDAGFSDGAALRGSEDLASLRSDPAWPRILGWVDRNAAGHPLEHGTGLVASTPEAEGIDLAALARLLKEAEEAHSSGLVLLRHGKLVGEWYFGGKSHRIEAMSATKSVVSLAVGLLLDEGKLQSLDEPVATFFPEWRGDPRSRITVRHLLNHTSGLFTHRTAEKIYASRDFVRYALETRLDAEPGTTFAYNNSATNLLAGVVTAAAGEPLDEYLRRRLFGPMGIEDVTWSRDDVGNRHGMSGMQIHPVDFAKIGQMMLDGGVWQGRRIVSEEWIRQSALGPAQPLEPTCGLLWWLEANDVVAVIDDASLEALRKGGLPASVVDKLAALPGRRISVDKLRDAGIPDLKPYQRKKLQQALRRQGVKSRTEIVGGYLGFSARGYLGQQLVVMPGQQLVGVRMAEYTDVVKEDVLTFSQFPKLLRALVPAQPAH